MRLLRQFIRLAEAADPDDLPDSIVDPNPRDVFRDNLRQMARLSRGYDRWVPWWRDPDEQPTWDMFFRQPHLDKALFRDISRSKQLHTRRVVDVLGAGAEGIAFGLDDGTVLKLGQLHRGATVPPGGGRTRYQSPAPWKYRAKQQKPGRTPLDLDVKDVGRAHVSMERVRSYEDWLAYQSPEASEAIDWAYGQLYKAFTDAKEAGLDPAGVTKRVMGRAHHLVDTGEVGDVLLRIAAAFANEVDNPSHDLNSGNLGVRGAPGQETFVFYDF